jgi:signal recognition particle subunit SRP54
VAEVNSLVDRFFDARKMMSQMAGQMGMPFGRKGSSRKAVKGKNKQAGKKKGGRGPTQPKAPNPLSAGGLPAGFPDLSNMPKGLDELPPGLANIDLSKLKFPGQK